MKLEEKNHEFTRRNFKKSWDDEKKFKKIMRWCRTFTIKILNLHKKIHKVTRKKYKKLQEKKDINLWEKSWNFMGKILNLQEKSQKCKTKFN